MALDGSSSWAQEVSLGEGESLIGLYQNEVGQKDKSIVISTTGLHLFFQNKVRLLAYKDIEKLDFASHDIALMKADPSKRILVIHLKSGEKVDLPILGMREHGADLPSFWSFLGGALDTTRIEERNAAAKQS